ncbi:hypothetical protein [Acetanaerobacterium elongatum]|uniref:Uncharacterized protein n=1 Tax=Acetanaerobacterium elongatum TaxID=258515 RepID=A0A1G9VZI2_9FIRM|nr:hypothetical protein [Acetanaerobacterium elongatum]SDM77709.1 hypothetical protein SAMN05192585_1054 [Acetanaerobacterium elongatum]
MTENEILRELHSCGMWFFVEYFNLLQRFSSDNNPDLIREEIINDLNYHKRPDGGTYKKSGTDIRLASAFIIFKNHAEYDSLKIITNAHRVDEQTKEKARTLLANYQIKDTNENNGSSIHKVIEINPITSDDIIVNPINDDTLNLDSYHTIDNQPIIYVDTLNSDSYHTIDNQPIIYVDPSACSIKEVKDIKHDNKINKHLPLGKLIIITLLIILAIYIVSTIIK